MVFSEYMTNWLYGEDGYYTKKRVIGKDGDFYTSVSSSRYFGGTLGYYLFNLIKENKLPRDTTVCEIGAHQGYLLSDLIQFVYSFDPDLLNTLKFVIVEPFSENRKMQLEYFEKSFGDAVKLHHVSHLDELEEENGFVVANELLDAFTCELYEDGKEAYVVDGKLEWREARSEIKDFATKYNITKGEIPIEFDDFFKSLTTAFKKLEFITFDYGEWEFLNRFTIRTYLKHETKPYEEIDFQKDYKISDITYDVPFKYTKDLAEKYGLEGMYSTQVKALLEMGILDLLETLQKHVSHEEYLRETATVKTLIDPTILGERFKALRLSN